MESILDLTSRLTLDDNLLKLCNVQLLTSDDIVRFVEKDDWHLSLKIDIEHNLAYEKLYIGSWNEVPEDYRRTYLILSFLKAFQIVRKHEGQNQDQLLSALNILDTGIVIGTGLDECSLLTDFAQVLHEMIVDHHPFELLELPVIKSSSVDTCDIMVLDQPSEELFWTTYFHLHRPAKLVNCINHWPAATKWLDLNYFITTAGYRTVPIELGKKYDSEDWSQGMFRFGEFLKEFMSSNSNFQSGYLAQHDLFDQIPQLRKDIVIPDYCAIGINEPVIKSWIGPANTISSMHTDDKHNLLCQVMGEKLVILAAPQEADYLYPHEGLLKNTSQVDPENLDAHEFPLAQNVKFLKVILKAGEMLYIPKLWFHHVRSLTTSVSVSFWFDVENQ